MIDPRDIRIAELEEQVRQLKAMLGMEPDLSTLAAIRDHLGLSPVHAALVTRLHQAGCAWVSVNALDLAVPQQDEANPRHVKTISVHICKLRKRFGEDFILNYWGRGYTLGAPGVLLVREALEREPDLFGAAA